MCRYLSSVIFILRFSCSDLLRKTCPRCCSVGHRALSWAPGARVSNDIEVTDLSEFRFFLCVRRYEDGKGEKEIGTGNTGQVSVQTDTSPGV